MGLERNWISELLFWSDHCEACIFALLTSHCAASFNAIDLDSYAFTLQVLVLWLLAFWLLGSWLLPTSLEFAGFERDDLSRRGQALVHLLLDFGQLGLTLAILYRRLKAYRPRHLGWFHTHLLPIQQWLPSVLGAACMFPILNTIAQQAQVPSAAANMCLSNEHAELAGSQ